MTTILSGAQFRLNASKKKVSADCMCAVFVPCDGMMAIAVSGTGEPEHSQYYKAVSNGDYSIFLTLPPDICRRQERKQGSVDINKSGNWLVF